MARSKRSRIRGRKTCGWGIRKKRRGKGSRGGKGMAGTGKRAGHHRTWVFRYIPDYLGKKGKGFRSMGQKKNKKLTPISILQIASKLDYFLKEGTAKKTEKGIEINLKGYKVLSQGKVEKAITVKANAFSESAIRKIKEAGGEAVVL